jgi:hypothetical protein
MTGQVERLSSLKSNAITFYLTHISSIQSTSVYTQLSNRDRKYSLSHAIFYTETPNAK